MVVLIELTVITMTLHTTREDMTNMIETIMSTEVEVMAIPANKLSGRVIGKDILTWVQSRGDMIMGSNIVSQIQTKEAILARQSTRQTTIKGATT